MSYVQKKKGGCAGKLLALDKNTLTCTLYIIRSETPGGCAGTDNKKSKEQQTGDDASRTSGTIFYLAQFDIYARAVLVQLARLIFIEI